MKVLDDGYSTTQLSFVAPPLPPADHTLSIYVPDKGLAALARWVVYIAQYMMKYYRASIVMLLLR